jgi:hypothetical protein
MKSRLTLFVFICLYSMSNFIVGQDNAESMKLIRNIRCEEIIFDPGSDTIQLVNNVSFHRDKLIIDSASKVLVDTKNWVFHIFNPKQLHFDGAIYLKYYSNTETEIVFETKNETEIQIYVPVVE